MKMILQDYDKRYKTAQEVLNDLSSSQVNTTILQKTIVAKPQVTQGDRLNPINNILEYCINIMFILIPILSVFLILQVSGVINNSKSINPIENQQD